MQGHFKKHGAGPADALVDIPFDGQLRKVPCRSAQGLVQHE